MKYVIIKFLTPISNSNFQSVKKTISKHKYYAGLYLPLAIAPTTKTIGSSPSGTSVLKNTDN